MRGLIVMVMICGATAGCRGKREAWPKAAGTTPYREVDEGQQLAPQHRIMDAVERGGPSPAKAAKGGASSASVPASVPVSAPASAPPVEATTDAPDADADADAGAIVVEESPN